jgi:D-alanine-D-alanine ligase
MEFKNIAIIVSNDLQKKSALEIFGTLKKFGYSASIFIVDENLANNLNDNKIDCAFLDLSDEMKLIPQVNNTLQCLAIPFAGYSIVQSSILDSQKALKEICKLHSIPTSEQLNNEEQAVSIPFNNIGFSSSANPHVGSTSKYNDLENAINNAKHLTGRVSAEKQMHGTDISIAVLNGKILGSAEVINFKSKFKDKNRSELMEIYLPPRKNRSQIKGLEACALKISKMICPTGPLVVDAVISPRGQEYIVGFNNNPPLGKDELFAITARAYGVLYEEVIIEILESSNSLKNSIEISSNLGQPNIH